MQKFAIWFAKPYVALGFLALGMAVIPVNDALIKLLGETLPLGQIVAIRSIISIAEALLLAVDPFAFLPSRDDFDATVRRRTPPPQLADCMCFECELQDGGDARVSRDTAASV